MATALLVAGSTRPFGYLQVHPPARTQVSFKALGCSYLQPVSINTCHMMTMLLHRFSNFLARALKSDSPLIQTVYQWASNRTFTAPSFNNLYKNFVKFYTVDDHICAEFIWDIQLGRLTFDSADILNTFLYSVYCD